MTILTFYPYFCVEIAKFLRPINFSFVVFVCSPKKFPKNNGIRGKKFQGIKLVLRAKVGAQI